MLSDGARLSEVRAKMGELRDPREIPFNLKGGEVGFKRRERRVGGAGCGARVGFRLAREESTSSPALWGPLETSREFL